MENEPADPMKVLDELEAAAAGSGPPDGVAVVLAKAVRETSAGLLATIRDLVKGRGKDKDEEEDEPEEEEETDEDPDKDKDDEDPEKKDGKDGFRDMEKGQPAPAEPAKKPEQLDVTEWVVSVGKHVERQTELLKSQGDKIDGIIAENVELRKNLGAALTALDAQSVALAKAVVGIGGQLAGIPAAEARTRVGNGTDPGGRHINTPPAQQGPNKGARSTTIKATPRGDRKYIGGSDDVETRVLAKGQRLQKIDAAHAILYKSQGRFSTDENVDASIRADLETLVASVR